MLYIVPLQEELDMAPLAFDAEEFALMPKMECKNCKKSMALQLLALHVTQCDDVESTDSEAEVKFTWNLLCNCFIETKKDPRLVFCYMFYDL